VKKFGGSTLRRALGAEFTLLVESESPPARLHLSVFLYPIIPAFFGVFGFFFSHSTAMAEVAGPSEPPPSSGGPNQPDDDATSSAYTGNKIQCGSCGRWEGPDQFQSKAKGHRPHTKTCLRCRGNKVRLSHP
jgi:hypothetical protein